MKLRMTVVYEYEADPEFYETEDPKKMAEIDMPNWLDLLSMEVQYDGESKETVKVKIEPVEE